MALLAAGCEARVRDCKAGTVFVEVELRGAAASATVLEVAPYLEGVSGTNRSLLLTGGATVSFAYEFPSGYPTGAELRLDLAARANGVIVATGSVSSVLDPGCTKLAPTLGELPGGDDGGRDGGGDGSSDGGIADAATPDLLVPLDFANLPDGIFAPGAACVDASQCATGNCVDGVCCLGACTGQCESCNETGAAGTCLATFGAPRGARAACTGSGECADSCNGTERATCTSKEALACGAAICAGGTLSGLGSCVDRACVQTTTPCELGCLGTTDCVGVVQTAHGYYHSCAVLSDGTTRCWGSNMTGELGNTSVSPPTGSDVPIALNGPPGAVRVGATYGATCVALGTGKVQCWGANSAGQLGRGGAVDANPHSDNADVVGIGDADYVVGGSGGMYCAHRTSNGGLLCWGGGNLGDGNGNSTYTTPSEVCAADSTAFPCSAVMTNVRGIAIGDNHACAIQDDFTVACWGENDRLQLGTDLDGSADFPVTISGLAATHLSAGNRTTCAVERNTGTVKCWGAAERLGHGLALVKDTATPTEVCTDLNCTAFLTGMTATAQFDETVCAVGGGAVRCWGGNSTGQLGDGSATSSQSFAATFAIAPTATLSATGIAAGGGFFCATVAEKSQTLLRCWGSGGSGELGNDLSMTSNVPVSPLWN